MSTSLSPSATPSKSYDPRWACQQPPQLELPPTLQVDVPCDVESSLFFDVVVSNPSECEEYPDGRATLDTVVSLAPAVLLPTGWHLEVCESLYLVIQPDRYPQEISWTITQTRQEDGNTVVAVVAEGGRRGVAIPSLCAAVGDIFTLTMRDAARDGICCAYGEGGYALWRGDHLVASGAEYAAVETTSFVWEWGVSLPSQSSAEVRGRIVVDTIAAATAVSLQFKAGNDGGVVASRADVTLVGSCAR
jgi:hypothetical protein